jgi:hypothetical protein
MEYSKFLKFQSLVIELKVSDCSKKIILGLLSKSEILSRTVHFLVPKEDDDELRKLSENETFLKCFSALETDFKFSVLSNEEKSMVILSNLEHFDAVVLSKKEVNEIDLSKDPLFNRK